MKKIVYRNLRLSHCLFAVAFLLLAITSCKKTNDASALNAQSSSKATINPGSMSGYQKFVLVANTQGYGAPRIEPKLVNAWGMSASDEGEIWISAADAGLSFVYDKTGAQLMPPVNIPSHKVKQPGAPTGNIYNETGDFVIPGTGMPSEFIFASEDGTISAWNSGSSAVIVADRSKKDASYKGLAIAEDGGNNFLYVTNFAKNRIDVFDKNFNHVTDKHFKDNDMPEGYTPFNIRNINNMLYVTYALKTADGEEDSTGIGLGFVDVFNPDGSMEKRFASHGTLNAPWGIVATRDDFAGMNAILIGNFGDGHINAFDYDGNFLGLLMDQGSPVTIEGLWALENEIAGTSAWQLYFTAGPNEESDGVFGFLAKR